MSVKFSKQEMLEMENLISLFLKKTNIKLSIPVDIFKVATELGFDVRGALFEDQLEGMILVNEFNDKIEGFDSNKVIAYNCQKDINTKKFIVAHELAHYIYQKTNANDKRIVVAARDHKGNYSNDKIEQRMDYIAASLLVPKEHLLNNKSVVNPSQIAEHYNVSLELAERRFEEVHK